MKNQLIVICANDSIELAFLPDTLPAVIAEEVERLEQIWLKKCPQSYTTCVHIHTRTVKVFENMQPIAVLDKKLATIIRKWAGDDPIRNEHLTKYLNVGITESDVELFTDMDDDNAQEYLSEVMHNTGIGDMREVRELISTLEAYVSTRQQRDIEKENSNVEITEETQA